MINIKHDLIYLATSEKNKTLPKEDNGKGTVIDKPKKKTNILKPGNVKDLSGKT